MGETILAWTAIVHGLYYLVTAIWPLVSMRTFMAVTGPKVDQWLVLPVGLLIGVTAGVCLLAVYPGRFTSE